MMRVGMTGGIAAGKSTAASMFADLGVQVIDADDLVHQQMLPGYQANRKIVEYFGSDVCHDDGSINREQLKRCINDPDQLYWLEHLLHPLVQKQALASVRESAVGYVLFVVPLLFETSFINLVDLVLVIDVDESMQWQRAMAREGMHEKQLNMLLARQSSRQYRLARADFVLDGSLDLTALRQHVITLDMRFRDKASRVECTPTTKI